MRAQQEQHRQVLYLVPKRPGGCKHNAYPSHKAMWRRPGECENHCQPEPATAAALTAPCALSVIRGAGGDRPRPAA